MRSLARIVIAFAAVLVSVSSNAGSDSYDVFVPISKYLALGDVESLSSWFADNLEISIMSTTNDSSKNQAKQILKTFSEVVRNQSHRIKFQFQVCAWFPECRG